MKKKKNGKIAIVAISAIVVSYLIAIALTIPAIPDWYMLFGLGMGILVLILGMLFKNSLTATQVFISTIVGILILHIPYIIITQCQYKVSWDIIWQQFITGSGLSYSLIGALVGYLVLLLVNYTSSPQK